MKRETILARAGSLWDSRTGAVTMPVYQTATFRHPALGQSTGFDYSRSGNPTRNQLEETLALLDGGERGFAFASGLAAVSAVMCLFSPGDRIVATEDLYGGTFRLLEKVHARSGLIVTYVDTSDLDAVRNVLNQGDGVKAIFVESLTNPLLKVADIPAIVGVARERGVLSIVDNTFLTPVLHRPIEHGADIVIYSASKYLSGHNDVVAGAVVAATTEIANRIYFYQNAIGAVLGPQDSWLVLRGLKTLHLRMQRQEENAQTVAWFLLGHPAVSRVYYPGLETDPGFETLRKIADGFGGMVAFEVVDPGIVPAILSGVEVFLFAESLGGTESLITFPSVQTHADISPEMRARLGINERLLRLSLGVENFRDLLEDLDRVLK